MPRVRRLVLLLPAVFVVACGASAPRVNPLTARASFDMNCPAAELRYTKLGESVWGVAGCGTRGTYVRRCEKTYFNGLAVDEDCSWILNGTLARGSAP